MKPRFSLSWLSADLTTWLWRVVPIGAVLVVKVTEQLQNGVLLGAMWLDLQLLVGWIAGWLVASADHLMYAMVCNPQELSCQRVRQEIDRKDWRRAWAILEETKGERTRLPIRNILTAFVMTGLGIWVVTSSGSLLASGIVFGFGVRLFAEIIADQDWRNWYWVFARQFAESEHRGLLLVWAGGLIWQWFTLLRG